MEASREGGLTPQRLKSLPLLVNSNGTLLLEQPFVNIRPIVNVENEVITPG
jgi:hypothetical protein